MNLTHDQRRIMAKVFNLEDEVLFEIKNRVPQTQYIIRIDARAYWDTVLLADMPVPDELVGYWMMREAARLTYVPVREAIKIYNWAKCEKQEITTHTWVIA